MKEFVDFIVSNSCWDNVMEYLSKKNIATLSHDQHNFISVEKDKITEEMINEVLAENIMHSMCRVGDVIYKFHKGKIAIFVLEE